ncbi:MAG: VanZ family protein [Ruminococcus sp.]|nr:VanZ family protein [Ruminococcus sp.]
MKPISKKINNIFHVTSIVYGLVLLYVLFLRSIGHDHALTYTEYLKYMSNFIPFISIYNLFTTPVISTSIVLSFLINFLGNIFLFIPWGFLLPLHFKSLRNFKQFISTTLITILLIESIQLFTMLGIFDIEDIILNAFGACIGFLCCKKLSLWKLKV